MGLFFPTAGWLCPQDYCQQMANWLVIQGVEIIYNTQVHQIKELEHYCKLETSAGTLHAATVVLATGAQLNSLAYHESFPLRQIRGQVSHLQSQR